MSIDLFRRHQASGVRPTRKQERSVRQRKHEIFRDKMSRERQQFLFSDLGKLNPEWRGRVIAQECQVCGAPTVAARPPMQLFMEEQIDPRFPEHGKDIDRPLEGIIKGEGPNFEAGTKAAEEEVRAAIEERRDQVSGRDTQHLSGVSTRQLLGAHPLGEDAAQLSATSIATTGGAPDMRPERTMFGGSILSGVGTPGVILRGGMLQSESNPMSRPLISVRTRQTQIPVSHGSRGEKSRSTANFLGLPVFHDTLLQNRSAIKDIAE